MNPQRLAIPAVIGCLVFAWRWQAAVERQGALAATVQQRDHTIAALRTTARTADTVFVRDTLRLTRTVTRYAALRDTLLLHTTDTLTVERFVAAADSTVEACAVTLRDCRARGDAWQAVADSERAQIQALTHAKRGCRVAVVVPCPRPFIGAGLTTAGKLGVMVGVGIGL